MQENNTFNILAYEKEIQTTIKNEEEHYFSHSTAALNTTISLHEWHEYFNSLANSPLPIHTSCKGPNTATHDQEVDETHATEGTQHIV